MKKSNIILFSYIGVLASAFLVFAIYITSMDRQRKVDNHHPFKQVKVELPDFTYVKINRQDVTLSRGKSNMAFVTYSKDSVAPDIVWRLEGDTLCLDASEDYDILTLKIGDQLSLKLGVIQARASIENIQFDSLCLIGKKARFGGFNNTTIKNLNVNLHGSNMDVYRGKLSSVKVDIVASRVVLNKSVSNIQGKLRNKSSIQLTRIKDINLNLDESSRLNCY